MPSQVGVSIACNQNGDRFYNPPAVRRHRERPQERQIRKAFRQWSEETREDGDDDDCASVSSEGMDGLTNLDRFLEYTTPLVPAHCLPKTSIRGCGNHEDEFHPYFVLGDLWDSFIEWSAYGAGVPLLLNGCDSVVQYYVPYLSGIQLYVDPSRPSSRLSRRSPGGDSDAESSRETSSNDSSKNEAERGENDVLYRPWNQLNLRYTNAQSLNTLSLRNKPIMASSSGDGEISNPPGLLVFEYLERDPPYSREPLADKISYLASQFPDLRTLRSCDLLPSSWISVAWYPIYRIPTGPMLRNLEACFLTFHSLSTLRGKSGDFLPHCSIAVFGKVPGGNLINLSLPVFGLAHYKFKISVWDRSGVIECQKANSLLQAADKWLRLLHVNHPDYKFFVSHNSA